MRFEGIPSFFAVAAFTGAATVFVGASTLGAQAGGRCSWLASRTLRRVNRSRAPR